MSNILILHPDLGIGGAERLIVDVALAVKQKGHKVHLITSHHDTSHCFEETRNGELEVTVVGDWIPRNIFGRFYALMAYIRMLYAALYIALSNKILADIIICDQVSVAIPVLKFKCSNVIFYCHHPDQLLSKPGGSLKSFYRAPLNWWEEVTTGKATHIFVNSNYTGSVFTETFKRLSVKPDVLYPSLHTESFDNSVGKPLDLILPKAVPPGSTLFLSINRYERKKDLKLALESLNQLRGMLSEEEWDKVQLVMAGGYDSRVDENVNHFTELVQLSTELKLEEKVTFLKSPKDSDKITLLKSCSCLIYTPTNEHFGIVPIEAMYMGRPVIAANSGGPTETILHNITGFLCEPTPQDFAKAMLRVATEPQLINRLGQAGKNRVVTTFSFQSFATQIDDVINHLLCVKTK